jgi:hypothetical protein
MDVEFLDDQVSDSVPDNTLAVGSRWYEIVDEATGEIKLDPFQRFINALTEWEMSTFASVTTSKQLQRKRDPTRLLYVCHSNKCKDGKNKWCTSGCPFEAGAGRRRTDKFCTVTKLCLEHDDTICGGEATQRSKRVKTEHQAAASVVVETMYLAGSTSQKVIG